MAWTRPKLREICIGMEINGYFAGDSLDHEYVFAAPILIYTKSASAREFLHVIETRM